MNPEYILWGVPAYLAFLVFQLAKPVRNRSGWDFVVSIACFAFMVYATASVIYFGLHRWIAPAVWATWAHRWGEVLHAPGAFRLTIGLVVAPLIGLVVGTIWSKWLHRFLSWSAFKLTGKRKSYQFSDVFFATCHDLLGEQVLLTLNNSKVYVGVLLQATDDPNEPARYIRIMPVMSGHRIEDGQVIFDTDYVGYTKDQNTLPNRDLLISMTNVVTLARFDRQLHDWFVDTGRTIIRSSAESEVAAADPDTADVVSVGEELSHDS